MKRNRLQMYMDTLKFLSENNGERISHIQVALSIQADTMRGILDLASQRGEVNRKGAGYSSTDKGLKTYSEWKIYEEFSERLNHALESSDKNEKK